MDFWMGILFHGFLSEIHLKPDIRWIAEWAFTGGPLNWMDSVCHVLGGDIKHISQSISQQIKWHSQHTSLVYSSEIGDPLGSLEDLPSGKLKQQFLQALEWRSTIKFWGAYFQTDYYNNFIRECLCLGDSAEWRALAWGWVFLVGWHWLGVWAKNVPLHTYLPLCYWMFTCMCTRAWCSGLKTLGSNFQSYHVTHAGPRQKQVPKVQGSPDMNFLSYLSMTFSPWHRYNQNYQKD